MSQEADFIVDRRRMRRKLTFWRVITAVVIIVALIGGGLVVTGVDVVTFCKLCGECIEVCPEKLFEEAPFEEHWPEEMEATP